MIKIVRKSKARGSTSTLVDDRSALQVQTNPISRCLTLQARAHDGTQHLVHVIGYDDLARLVERGDALLSELAMQPQPAAGSRP